MTDLAAGSIVENPLKSEWGPGKVVRVRGNKVDVFFRDLSGNSARTFSVDSVRLTLIQSDPVLDNLPPFREDGGSLVLSSKRVTLEAARRRFLDYFPGGFHDSQYIGNEKTGERPYKWAAHERFLEIFEDGRGDKLVRRDDTDFVSVIRQVLGSASNLMAVQEYIALQEGLADQPSAQRYFSTLLDLVNGGPDGELFTAHARAAASLPVRGQTHTDKWTVATILPYLARPEAFMFVKPTPTRTASERLGFEIRYDPRPNWTTYDKVLQMSRLYLGKLADLGPRDFIDIQSFFWITGESFQG